MREVGILKKDPEAIREQIEKLEMMSKSWSFGYLLSYDLGILLYFFQTKMFLLFLFMKLQYYIWKSVKLTTSHYIVTINEFLSFVNEMLEIEHCKETCKYHKRKKSFFSTEWKFLRHELQFLHIYVPLSDLIYLCSLVFFPFFFIFVELVCFI